MKFSISIVPLTILCFSLASCSTTRLTSENKSQTNISEMDIYLLIGQSNMAGRAVIQELDKDSLNGVFLYTSHPEIPWEKAANPLNKYSTIRKKLSMQRLSPAYSFAQKMATTTDGKPIGLVVNARGGTSIDLWTIGSDYYNAAINRTKDALLFGKLKGIVWHQGESDANQYETYLPKMVELISALRKEFGDPTLPFVAGQLSPDKPHRHNFNQMILDLPKHLDRVAVISTEQTTTTDSTHFDSASQRLLGQRYAAAMRSLLNN